ncbi:hypothetical protein D3C72_2307820 [compost metagenome]
MTRIRIHRCCGSTASTTRAKIKVGIAIIRSLKREKNWSTKPPMTAAVNDRIMPSENESTVAASATKMVVRAP